MTPSTFEFCSECFVWCSFQVTVFAGAALVIHSLTCLRSSVDSVRLLAGSLSMIAALTLLCWSPWPQWPLLAGVDAFQPSSRIVSDELDRIESPTLNTSSPRDAWQKVEGATPSAEHQLSRKAIAPRPLASAKLPQSSVDIPHMRTWWLVTMGAMWLLVAVGVARFAAGLTYLRRCRRQCIPVRDEDLLQTLLATINELQISISVELAESPLLDVPATLGWQRPIVLLPVTWRNWSTNERRAVLAHELAHVAQQHFPLWLLGQLAVAAHYYHPLVHWLGRRLRLEQELAADRVAVTLFHDRRTYVEVLAGLALGRSQPTHNHARLGLNMSHPLLMRRIAMLRTSTGNARQPSRVAVPTGWLALFTILVVVLGLRSARVAAAIDDASGSGDVPANRPLNAVVPSTPSPLLADNAPRPSADSSTATALFQVSRRSTGILLPSKEPISDEEWRTFRNTQLALLRSHMVTEAALRDPGIMLLPLIQSQADAEDWLMRNLDVGFQDDSEIMYVRITGRADEHGQLCKIVNAVATAYLNEIVFADQQQRFLLRDALAGSYGKLSDELRNKLDTQHQLASELGVADQDGKARVMQDLDIKRLERVESELMRLEGEQMAAEIYAEQENNQLPARELARLPFYKKRIAELCKRQAELEQRIANRNASSVELTVGASELKQLQAIASEMNLKLEQLEIETVSPPRIRLVQQAM